LINFDANLPNAPANPPGEAVPEVKNLLDLRPGDRFKALVTDIKLGLVTVRLPDGSFFTARTRVLPEARIGEESLFLVKENDFKGQIKMEMLKPDPVARQSGMLREALRNAGLFVTEENMNLARAILENDLPVDAQTLLRAVFFKYANQTETPADRVVFLLRENFPAESASLQILEKILRQPDLLGKNLLQIADALAGDKSPEAREIIRALFTSEPDFPPDSSFDFPDEPKRLQNLLRKHFFLMINNSDSPVRVKPSPARGLNRYYNEVYESVSRALSEITAKAIKHPAAERMETVKEALRFMEQTDKHREYFQIPFMTGPQEEPKQAELFVFKDAKRASDPAKPATALISLETLSFGRAEVYIQKSGNEARLDFRLTDEETVKTFNANSPKLTRALREKNITVSGLSFQKSDGVFTLLSPEPGGQNDAQKKELPKRFTFDMRV
jgi:hypothetical protein